MDASEFQKMKTDGTLNWGVLPALRHGKRFIEQRYSKYSRNLFFARVTESCVVKVAVKENKEAQFMPQVLINHTLMT